MNGRHEWDEPASFAAVALDDMLVDALAAGDAADETDPAFVLLAGLRADVSSGLGAAADSSSDVSLVHLSPAWRHRARRLSRGAVAASAAVVTVLSAGGVAAASVNAGPNSVLYPVRKVLLGPAESPLDPVYRLLNSARQALHDGDAEGARLKVDAARHKLQAIGEDAGKARTDLSTLEQAVATAQQPIAPATAPEQQATTPTSTQPPAGDTTTAVQPPGDTSTVDPGSHVDNDASEVPSPEPTTTAPAPSDSPSPSPSPSASPSPTGGTSPSPSPSSTATGAQQPRAEGSPSPAPTATTP